MDSTPRAPHSPPHSAHGTHGAPAGVGPIRPVLLADLTGDLLWPRLFRAAALAMRPERWILGSLALAAVVFTIRLAESTATGAAWFSRAGASIDRAREHIGLEASRHDLTALTAAIARAARALLLELPLSAPLATSLIILPIAIVLTLAGLAISRMAAMEFGQGVLVRWPAALAFALSRITSALGALMLAPLAAVLIALALAIAGWLLLNWPVVQVLGAVLYPLFMLAALAAVLLLSGMALGKHLLIPAISCEGADALDAFQRSLSYVFGSPLRVLVYLAISLAQVLIAGALIWMLASWTTGFAGWATSAWISPPNPGTADPGWSQRTSDAFIDLWHAIPTLLVGGFVISAYFTSSTIAYLLLRRHHDGQDPADLWMPTMIPGTLADATAPRRTNDEDE